MHVPAARQLSLFGVEARPPVPADLEGLLAGAGQVSRMGGTARISVVVTEPWRAAALRGECGVRGLPAIIEPLARPEPPPAELPAAAGEPPVEPTAPPGRVEPPTLEVKLLVRTAYAAVLAPIGARWLRGVVKRPPEGFVLDGRRLRLWAIAGGRPDGVQAYRLALDPQDPTMWELSGKALAAAGLPATLLDPGAGGPAYRIVGRRRLARLAELIGDAPRPAPPEAWL